MKILTQSRLLVPMCVVAIGGLVTLPLLRHRTPQGSAVQLIVGVDVSDSVRQQDAAGGSLMGRSIALLARLATNLDSDRDHVVAMRVERTTREFYNGKAPESREKFLWSLISQTRVRATSDGTFPAKFWNEAADCAQGSSLPVAIAYVGDADNDDLSAAATSAMKIAARRLAANPRVVSVWFFGANSKNWASLRAAFAPLGDRLHLQNADTMDAAPLLDELEAARH